MPETIKLQDVEFAAFGDGTQRGRGAHDRSCDDCQNHRRCPEHRERSDQAIGVLVSNNTFELSHGDFLQND